MTATLRRLLALAGMPRRRVALSVALGALAVAFGVGLLATSGLPHLARRGAAADPLADRRRSSRALLRARAAARALPRPARVARPRAARARRASARAFTSGSSRSRPASSTATGAATSSAAMVGDVDALQGLYLRGIGPPLVALVVGAGVRRRDGAAPAGRRARARGRAARSAASPCPRSPRALGRAVGRRQAAARGELTAELVELLRGAPELVVYGREDDALAAHPRRPTGSSCASTAATRSSPGSPTRSRSSSPGSTVAGVLAVAVAAHSTGTLDRVLVGDARAARARVVRRGRAAARAPRASCRRRSPPGRRVLELTDERAGRARSRASRCPRPPAPAAVALEDVTARYAPDEPTVLERLRPAARAGTPRRARRPERRRQDDGDEPPASASSTRSDGRVTIAGEDLRALPAGGRARDVRARRPGGARLRLDDPREPPPRAARRERRRARRRARAGAARRLGRVAPRRARHARRRGGHASSPAGSASGSCSRGRCSRDAPVLVLDEPTAHLDPPTAERLMDDVLDAAGDRTVLLITHRREGLDADGRGRVALAQRERLARERGQRLRGDPERRRRVLRGVAEAAVGARHPREVAERGGRRLRARGEERLDRPRRRLHVRAGARLELEAAVLRLARAEVREGARRPAAPRTPTAASASTAAAVSSLSGRSPVAHAKPPLFVCPASSRRTVAAGTGCPAWRSARIPQIVEFSVGPIAPFGFSSA